MGQPVLMYGIGATKAGTSWLYDYLVSHPRTHIRGVKELHFWDFDGSIKSRFTLRELKRRLTQLDNNLIRAATRGRLDAVERIKGNQASVREAIALHTDPTVDSYLEYLFSGAKNADVVADITPAYAMAGIDTLRRMQDVGRETKFVYLLRDPVARVWSHIRMNAGRGADEAAAREAVDELFEKWARGNAGGISARGDYAATLNRLKHAVPVDHLYIGFYEELFHQDGADAICRFLGLPPHPGAFDKRVWSSLPAQMSDDQFLRAREILAPQYDAVLDHMGRVPEIWQETLEATP